MKATVIALLIAFALIVGAFFIVRPQSDGGAPANNVTMEGDTQIIEIRAKGGYQPRKSVATAGIPTVVRFNTSGTFDCSSSVRFPTLGISQILPQSGSVDIAIGTGTVGTLKGTCGMGMYPFEIEFKSV